MDATLPRTPRLAPKAIDAAMRRALRAGGHHIDGHRPLADVLHTISRRDTPPPPPLTRDDDASPWHPLLDMFVAELAEISGEIAYEGLGWALGWCSGDVQAYTRLQRATPGEIEAAELLAPVWPVLHTRGVALRPLWRTMWVGHCARWLQALGADGHAGADAALACVRASRDLAARIPFGGCTPKVERAHIRRLLASWACHADPHDATQMVACEVIHSDTLQFVARLDPRPRCVPALVGGQHGCAADARLRIDGRPLWLRCLVLAPSDVSDADDVTRWLEEACGDLPIALGTRLTEFRPGVRPHSALHWGGEVWAEHGARGVTPRGACTHPDGRWTRNHTETALKLSCLTCGMEDIALCWRDELPEDHPHAILDDSPEAARVCELRATLRQIGAGGPPCAPLAGRRLTHAALLPERFAFGIGRPPASRRGTTEATLTRRR